MKTEKVNYDANFMDTETNQRDRAIHNKMERTQKDKIYMKVSNNSNDCGFAVVCRNKIFYITKVYMSFTFKGKLYEFDEHFEKIEEFHLIVDAGGSGVYYSAKLNLVDCDGDIYFNSGRKDEFFHIWWEMVTEDEVLSNFYLSNAHAGTARAICLFHNKRLDDDRESQYFYELMNTAMKMKTE